MFDEVSVCCVDDLQYVVEEYEQGREGEGGPEQHQHPELDDYLQVLVQQGRIITRLHNVLKISTKTIFGDTIVFRHKKQYERAQIWLAIYYSIIMK